MNGYFMVGHLLWKYFFGEYFRLNLPLFRSLFKVLLDHNLTSVNIEGRNKYTALHIAAYMENRNALKVCQKLVRQRARFLVFHVIGFPDLVGLWVIKIKSP